MICDRLCEIAPALSTQLLANSQTEHWDIVTCLTQLITDWSNEFSWPLIHPAPIQVSQSLRSLSVPVTEHDRTYGWTRPK